MTLQLSFLIITDQMSLWLRISLFSKLMCADCHPPFAFTTIDRIFPSTDTAFLISVIVVPRGISLTIIPGGMSDWDVDWKCEFLKRCFVLLVFSLLSFGVHYCRIPP